MEPSENCIKAMNSLLKNVQARNVAQNFKESVTLQTSDKESLVMEYDNVYVGHKVKQVGMLE